MSGQLFFCIMPTLVARKFRYQAIRQGESRRTPCAGVCASVHYNLTCPAPFLRASVALSATESTQRLGADTVIESPRIMVVLSEKLPEEWSCDGFAVSLSLSCF